MHRPPTPAPADLLTTVEAAQILGLSRWKITRLALDGDIPVAYKAPGLRGARMFHRADVERIRDGKPAVKAAT